eukprot:4401340-Pleurochrysis_carterae.AAC.2
MDADAPNVAAVRPRGVLKWILRRRLRTRECKSANVPRRSHSAGIVVYIRGLCKAEASARKRTPAIAAGKIGEGEDGGFLRDGAGTGVGGFLGGGGGGLCRDAACPGEGALVGGSG